MQSQLLSPVSAGGDVEQSLRLETGADGRLWLLRTAGAVPVGIVRCFPWSEPEKYLSLRDEDNAEVAMVPDPASLDPSSRSALELAMAEAGFVFQVTGVLAVDEEVEIRHWTVDTVQGRRTFQTRLDDWPRGVAGGGMVIRDVAGDLYLITGADSLDAVSRKLLWAFVD